MDSQPRTAVVCDGRALGQSPQYWLNLQEAYDLKTAETAINEQLEAVTVLVPA